MKKCVLIIRRSDIKKKSPRSLFSVHLYGILNGLLRRNNSKLHPLFNIILPISVCVTLRLISVNKNVKGNRTTVHSEVDFVCNLGSKRYYIQSVFAIPDKEKMDQEIASLDHIDDSFKKIIIVGDIIKPWTNEKSYLIMSIYDFLLKIKQFGAVTDLPALSRLLSSDL